MPEDTYIILVGNKIDEGEKRQVTIEEGHDFAEKNELDFIETSAKTGENINKLFNQLTKAFCDTDLRLDKTTSSLITSHQSRSRISLQT